MLSRVKKWQKAGENWQTYTVTESSGTAQNKIIDFTVNRYLQSATGSVNGSANIANTYNATITYSDSSTAAIAKASFWTSQSAGNATFAFTNPHPEKLVTKVRANFYSYSAVVFSGTMTYQGHD